MYVSVNIEKGSEGFRVHPPGPICAYCGERATSIDHVRPRLFGGSDEPDNLVPACQPCNSSKGVLPVEIWRMGRSERTAWLKARGWTTIGGVNGFWQSPDLSDRTLYSKLGAILREAWGPRP
jgi:hypothetical protein